MALTELRKDALKLILLGGKGGVGKTTCALSTSFYLAQYAKILVISTDPAHSLSDSMGQDIGNEIKEVRSVKNLSALEINAEKAFSKFKLQYENQIKKILDTSTYLDHEDINSLFDLTIPGIDEVMGFKTIADLIEEAKFDKYIVDTAPTGHTLRFLTLPHLLDEWIKVMAKMRWKYRCILTSFNNKYYPDEGDDFLVKLKKTVKRINSLFQDSQKCEFIPVTMPEDMAISETERLVETLSKNKIKVKQLVVNNVLELNNCEFCRERKKEQGKYINRIREKFANLMITVVPLQPREIKGIETLENSKKLLFGYNGRK